MVSQCSGSNRETHDHLFFGQSAGQGQVAGGTDRDPHRLAFGQAPSHLKFALASLCPKKKQRDYLSIASLSEEGLLLFEEAEHFGVFALS